MDLVFIGSCCFLPLWVFILNHPFRIYRFLSKMFILLTIAGIFVGTPIYLVILLKKWTLLVLPFPILFRLIGNALYKFINTYKSLSKINKAYIVIIRSSIISSTIIVMCTYFGHKNIGVLSGFLFFNL